jgi:riboflavin kinase
VLQVPRLFALGEPLQLDAPVVTGFGRGSSQLGVATANMSPAALGAPLLASLRRGVYFGWARLDGDAAPRKAVLNVGVRPTFAPPPGVGEPPQTVEVHLLHHYSGPFYGARLCVLALGFIRPELRFAGGVPQLLARIRTDVGVAATLLDAPEMAAHAADPFLQRDN